MRLAERRALPLQHVRQPVGIAEEHVGHEDAADDQQRQAQRAVDRERPSTIRPTVDVVRSVLVGRPARSASSALNSPQVEAAHHAGETKDPVVPRDPVARTRLGQRKGQRGEKQAEGEMELPRSACCRPTEGEAGDFLQPERHRRGDVELEQRPDEGERDDELAGEAGRLPSAGVRCRQRTDRVRPASGSSSPCRPVPLWWYVYAYLCWCSPGGCRTKKARVMAGRLLRSDVGTRSTSSRVPCST